MNTNHLPSTVLGSHTHLLYSSFVDDEYELSIWLPPSYETSEQTYPTLYVLDSPLFFGSCVRNAQFQSWEAGVPELIVVGIGKRLSSIDEWWPIRDRDYAFVPVPWSTPGSGHGENFFKFIGQELIPFVDKNYRTNPEDRILYGQSLSGSFAIHTLFSQPNLFSRCIATAPAFDDNGQVILDYEPALAAASFPSEVCLFISISSLDPAFGPGAEAFAAAISAKEIPNLKFQKMTIEGLAHTPAAMPGFLYGIEAVYAM